MKKLLIALAFIAAIAVAQPALATDYSLSDMNSTAIVSVDTQAGMRSWVVDGVSNLYQQWFWYRVGTTGGQTSVDALPVQARLTDANFNPGNDTLVLKYTAADFVLDIKYSLQGGSAGSNFSDMGEQIKITNTSGQTLDFHFFQYSDFDLNGTTSDDTVQLVNANAVMQSDPLAFMSETVATPSPDRWELAQFASTLNALNGGTYNLNNNAGPLTGDVTWAFQWDFTIAPGGSQLISKDKLIGPVPEPGSMLLLGTGLFGLAGAVRRRMKK